MDFRKMVPSLFLTSLMLTSPFIVAEAVVFSNQPTQEKVAKGKTPEDAEEVSMDELEQQRENNQTEVVTAKTGAAELSDADKKLAVQIVTKAKNGIAIRIRNGDLLSIAQYDKLGEVLDIIRAISKGEKDITQENIDSMMSILDETSKSFNNEAAIKDKEEFSAKLSSINNLVTDSQALVTKLDKYEALQNKLNIKADDETLANLSNLKISLSLIQGSLVDMYLDVDVEGIFNVLNQNNELVTIFDGKLYEFAETTIKNAHKFADMKIAEYTAALDQNIEKPAEVAETVEQVAEAAEVAETAEIAEPAEVAETVEVAEPAAPVRSTAQSNQPSAPVQAPARAEASNSEESDSVSLIFSPTEVNKAEMIFSETSVDENSTKYVDMYKTIYDWTNANKGDIDKLKVTSADGKEVSYEGYTKAQKNSDALEDKSAKNAALIDAALDFLLARAEMKGKDIQDKYKAGTGNKHFGKDGDAAKLQESLGVFASKVGQQNVDLKPYIENLKKGYLENLEIVDGASAAEIKAAKEKLDGMDVDKELLLYAVQGISIDTLINHEYLLNKLAKVVAMENASPKYKIPFAKLIDDVNTKKAIDAQLASGSTAEDVEANATFNLLLEGEKGTQDAAVARELSALNVLSNSDDLSLSHQCGLAGDDAKDTFRKLMTNRQLKIDNLRPKREAAALIASSVVNQLLEKLANELSEVTKAKGLEGDEANAFANKIVASLASDFSKPSIYLNLDSGNTLELAKSIYNSVGEKYHVTEFHVMKDGAKDEKATKAYTKLFQGLIAIRLDDTSSEEGAKSNKTILDELRDEHNKITLYKQNLDNTDAAINHYGACVVKIKDTDTSVNDDARIREILGTLRNATTKAKQALN